MANKWVEHVRKWSAENGVTYMCATSMPECKEAYKKGKAPKNTKKANIEQMGMEDRDVALPKAKISADTLKDKLSQIKEAKKMGIEDIKSAMLRRAQGIVQPLQSADTAVVKPKGRPKKYETAEEARRMKSVKTVEARNRRRAEKAKAKEPEGAGYHDLQEVTDEELFRTMVQGGARDDDQIDNYSMIINHLVEHISDPSEPVDPRDYDQAIHFIREMRRAKGGAELYSREYYPRYGGAVPTNTGNEFLDVVMKTGHEMGKSHPASKFGLNPFDIGEKIGEKLGHAMMKTKWGNPKTGIFTKHFWTPKKHR